MRSVVLPEGVPAEVQKGFAQILAIHAALLPSGKILYFSGDQYDPGQHHHGMFDQARLFHCQTLAITAPPPAPFIRDLFCCGHAFLGDGRLLVAGGTEHWADAAPEADPAHGSHGVVKGIADAYVFDPATDQWIKVARMLAEPWSTVGGGRWYPTLMTLGTGHVLTVSGTASAADSRHFNDTIEEFQPAPGPTGTWVNRGSLPGDFEPGHEPLYPRAHLIKDGTVFFTALNGQSHKWNTATGVWTAVCPSAGGEYDSYATPSILLPLLPEFAYRTRVLACGDPQAKIIDLDEAAPAWTPTLPRTLLIDGTPPVRKFCDAVMLPTGDVLVCGGTRQPLDDPGSAVLPLELYHPVSNSWTTLPAEANAHVPRNYHAVALLMPDGRVWMAGSSIRADWAFHNIADFPTELPETPQQDGIDNRELRIELFEPWYFGRPDRPAITGAPASGLLGSTLDVATPQAATINRVVAVRAGSVTHSFNADQRLVGLTFTRQPNLLRVTLPDNANVVPPGPYLLFVLLPTASPEAGTFSAIPSAGHLIQITAPAPPTPPSLKIQLNATTYHTGDTMTVVATLTPGSAADPVDAYVVVRFPNGQFMSAQLNGPPVAGVVPIAKNIVPVSLQQQVIAYTFNGSEPPGAYTWFAALTLPNTLTFVSALEQDPFTFAP
jgi:hypothetical protein